MANWCIKRHVGDTANWISHNFGDDVKMKVSKRGESLCWVNLENMRNMGACKISHNFGDDVKMKVSKRGESLCWVNLENMRNMGACKPDTNFFLFIR